MKLPRPPKKQSPEGVDLKRLVRAYQVVSMGLVAHLKMNSVVSDDELETVTRNVQDTLETVSHVLSRVLSLTETADLHRMKDVDLSVKLERQQDEVFYLVDLATVMLERLRNMVHITGAEHSSLDRYWRSLPVQHQRLVDRWQRATS
jgi:hypothetical protein